MPEKIRGLLVTRLIAIGFIYIIVLGNIWFAQGISGQKTPDWMMMAFVFGCIWVIVLGIALALQWLYLWQTDSLHTGEDYGTELNS